MYNKPLQARCIKAERRVYLYLMGTMSMKQNPHEIILVICIKSLFKHPCAATQWGYMSHFSLRRYRLPSLSFLYMSSEVFSQTWHMRSRALDGRWYDKYQYRFFSISLVLEVKKTAKIRKGFNQVPHLAQDATLESNKKKTINITN